MSAVVTASAEAAAAVAAAAAGAIVRPDGAAVAASAPPKQLSRKRRTSTATPKNAPARPSARPSSASSDAIVEEPWMTACGRSPYKDSFPVYYRDARLLSMCLKWHRICLNAQYAPAATFGHICNPSCQFTTANGTPFLFCRLTGNLHVCGESSCSVMILADDRSGHICGATGQVLAQELIPASREEGDVYDGHKAQPIEVEEEQTVDVAAADSVASNEQSHDATDRKGGRLTRAQKLANAFGVAGKRLGRARPSNGPSQNSIGHVEFGEGNMRQCARLVLDTLVLSDKARELTDVKDRVLELDPQAEMEFYKYCEFARELVVHSAAFKDTPTAYSGEYLAIVVLVEWLVPGYVALPLLSVPRSAFLTRHAVAVNHLAKFQIRGRSIIDSRITSLGKYMRELVIRWNRVSSADYPRIAWVPSTLLTREVLSESVLQNTASAGLIRRFDSISDIVA